MKPYIPEPCHEDWNAMTPKEKGRFCDACAKVVVDFTTMNDEEIVDYLQQHTKQKTCGHFRNEQLYQAEKLKINLANIPPNLSFKKYFAIALLISFTSLGLISCKSNNGKTVGKIEVVDSSQTIKSNLIDTNFIEGEIAPSVDSAHEIIGDVCVTPNDKMNLPPPPLGFSILKDTTVK